MDCHSPPLGSWAKPSGPGTLAPQSWPPGPTVLAPQQPSRSTHPPTLHPPPPPPRRTIQILRRETVRYDDQRGPIVLTLLLIAVTVVSFALALTSMRSGAPVSAGASGANPL